MGSGIACSLVWTGKAGGIRNPKGFGWGVQIDAPLESWDGFPSGIEAHDSNFFPHKVVYRVMEVRDASVCTLDPWLLNPSIHRYP